MSSLISGTLMIKRIQRPWAITVTIHDVLHGIEVLAPKLGACAW